MAALSQFWNKKVKYSTNQYKCEILYSSVELAHRGLIPCQKSIILANFAIKIALHVFFNIKISLAGVLWNKKKWSQSFTFDTENYTSSTWRIKYGCCSLNHGKHSKGYIVCSWLFRVFLILSWKNTCRCCAEWVLFHCKP